MNPNFVINPQVVVDEIATELLKVIEKMNHALDLGVETDFNVPRDQNGRYVLQIKFSKQIMARVGRDRTQ